MVRYQPTHIDRDDDLLIEVDSEEIAATRYRRRSDVEQRPIVLMYTPYRKDDWQSYERLPIIQFLTDNGYDVVVADMVGTGASTGLTMSPFTSAEGKQGAAVVEWLADQEWSNSRIGMYGVSYPGTTSLETAAQRPDGLEAIVPVHAPYEFNTAYYEGGNFALYRAGGAWAPIFEWLAALPPSRRDSDGRWADVWYERLDALAKREPYLFQYLKNESEDNDYWRRKEIPVGRIQTPTFAINGWRDPYPKTTLEFFDRIDAEKRLLLGPWRHTRGNEGQEVVMNYYEQILEWFDRFLKGEDSGALDHPNITIWTEKNDGGTIDGTWRGLSSWPTTDTTETLSFALSPAGLQRTTDFGSGSVERTHELDHTLGVASYDMDIEGGNVRDTNADDARATCFETAPLSKPIEWTGTAHASIRIVSEMRDPTLVVRVIDVAPNGSATLVTHGQLKASTADAATDDGLTPDTEYRLDVPLKPKSHRFDARHRVRIAISGAFFPFIEPTREHGTFTVRSSAENPSLITLPGRVYEGSFTDAVEMSEPDPRYVLGDPDVEWTVMRDNIDDRATLRTSQSYATEFPHTTLAYWDEIETSVQTDDPSSSTIQKRSEVSLDYETETVLVETSTRVSPYDAQVSNRVTVDGQVVFDEEYTHKRQ